MENARYQDLSEDVLRKTKGKCVVLIVLGGEKGNGFCVSLNASGNIPKHEVDALVIKIFKGISNELEKEIENAKQK